MIQLTEFDGPPPSEETVGGVVFHIGEKQMAFYPRGTGPFYIHEVRFVWDGRPFTIAMDAAIACNSSVRRDRHMRLLQFLEQQKERESW